MDTREVTKESCVANARIAAGLDILVRCASTDVLARRVTGYCQFEKNLGAFDVAILQRSGLIVDLRSGRERNEALAQSWMSTVEEAFAVQELQDIQPYEEVILKEMLQKHRRLVVRLDILSPRRFMSYLEQKWLSQEQRDQAKRFRVLQDKSQLHQLRMEALHKRGLLGLNEAILETGKQGLCTALQLITLHLERVRDQQNRQRCYDLVVIHCVQGKDRTGILAMLCQAIMGVSDVQIVEDYYRSHQNFGNTSGALERVTVTNNSKSKKKLFVRSLWNSAPRSVMEGTLQYLRSKYGSIAPGYLDNIGFSASWQQRFRAVGSQTPQSKL